MRLLDLLGRRWTLRIVWELRETSATFRSLRERCEDVSPSVLNTRLAELREAAIVEIADDGGYALTREGRALLPALAELDVWARKHFGTRRPPSD
jgi:DNA-binding HxlR family transcriptional regulator